MTTDSDLEQERRLAVRVARGKGVGGMGAEQCITIHHGLAPRRPAHIRHLRIA